MAMTTADISSELNLTLLTLGLFEDVVHRMVRDTCLDFARSTGAFQSDCEVELDAGESEASVLMDTSGSEDAMIVLQLARFGFKIPKCDKVQTGLTGIPTCYRDVTMNKVAFNKIAAESLIFTGLSLAIPKRNAGSYRDEFLQHKECLQHGVSAKVCLTRGGDWFNPDMAQYHAQEYSRLKQRAKAEAMQRLNQYVQVVRFI